jgi:hypothetical protein
MAKKEEKLERDLVPMKMTGENPTPRASTRLDACSA